MKHEAIAVAVGVDVVVNRLCEVCGPLNAVMAVPRPLDPAANPTSLYAEGGLFNFSYVRVARQADGKVHLVADVRAANGVPRPGSQLDLTPQ